MLIPDVSAVGIPEREAGIVNPGLQVTRINRPVILKARHRPPVVSMFFTTIKGGCGRPQAAVLAGRHHTAVRTPELVEKGSLGVQRGQPAALGDVTG